MDRVDRQLRIRDWNQAAIAGAAVVLQGMSYSGVFMAMALSMLGIRRLVWIGQPSRRLRPTVDWLCGRPFGETEIIELPVRAECTADLDWIVREQPVQAIVSCSPDQRQAAIAHAVAESRGTFWAYGTGAAGGLLSYSAPPRVGPREGVAAAMCVAAQMSDAVRERLVHPADAILPPARSFNLFSPRITRPASLTIVGAGGIGSSTVLGLAAADRRRLLDVTVVDHDFINLSNTNRQPFAVTEALDGRPKAPTITARARRLFPEAPFRAEVVHVDEEYLRRFVRDRAALPAGILSLVDNAQTRLLLQNFQRHFLPSTWLVQSATDVFAADTFVQRADGPLLDEQLYGALTRAVQAEADRTREGNCGDPSYVSPSLMAAGFTLHRTLQCLASPLPLRALRWRSGNAVCEEGDADHDLDQLVI